MNPIVAAHLNRTDLTPWINAPHIQLFEAFMWACEHNDVHLWAFLKTTPLNPTAGLTIPLGVVVKHNSWEMAQEIAPLLSEHICEFLREVIWNSPDAWSPNHPMRNKWLPLLLPHMTFGCLKGKDFTVKHIMERHGGMSVLVVALTANELQWVDPTAFEECPNEAFHMLFEGLRWCYRAKKEQAVKSQPRQKTQWVVTHVSLTSSQWERLLELAIEWRCMSSARAIQHHSPTPLHLRWEHFRSFFDKCSITQAAQILKTHTPPPYTQDEVDHFLTTVCNAKNTTNFNVALSSCSPHNDRTVANCLAQWAEKASASVREQFWKFFATYCYGRQWKWLQSVPHGTFNIPSSLPWENNQNLKTFSAEQTLQLAQTLLYEEKGVSRSNRFAAAYVNQSLPSTLLDGVPPDLLSGEEVFKGLLRSGNQILVEQAVQNGAKLCAGMLADLQEFWLADISPMRQELVRNLVRNHLIVNDPVDILNELSQCRVLPISVFDTPTPELFFNQPVIDNLSVYARAMLIGQAADHKRWNLLAKVLDCPSPITEFENGKLWAVGAGVRRSSDWTPEEQTTLFTLLSDKLDPWAHNSQAIATAVLANNLPLTQHLIPLCDPAANNSLALRLAAEHGEVSIVECLLKCSHPKAQNSQALANAVEGKHKDVVMLLLPVSSIPMALTHDLSDDDKQFLQECQNERQAQVLKSIVVHQHNHTDLQKRRM